MPDHDEDFNLILRDKIPSEPVEISSDDPEESSSDPEESSENETAELPKDPDDKTAETDPKIRSILDESSSEDKSDEELTARAALTLFALPLHPLSTALTPPPICSNWSRRRRLGRQRER